MALLQTFSTLALISGAILMLLPEGSLRKTAALVIGLLLMLCWAESLIGMLPESLRPQIAILSAAAPHDLTTAHLDEAPSPSFIPIMPLSPTDVSIDQTAAQVTRTLVDRFPSEVTTSP